MGAEDMTKQDLFNQLKGLIIATEDRLAAHTDKTDARLDGIASDFNAWRPRLEGRVDALQSAVAALQRKAATNVPPAEVPTPANPTDEVPAPAISDSDAKLVTIDVGESKSAPAPTTAPTEHMTTVDIVPVRAAPAATGGTLHGQAVSGVPSMPATCLMVCLARDPMASPVLVASSILAPPECVHGTNTILVAALPLATMGEFPAVLAPTDSTPTVQLQQLYNDSEFLMLPISSQCIIAKVAVHRPMPWPSFVGVHADMDDARPLPWPSFREINCCEFPSKFIEKAFRKCSSDSFRAESRAVVEFQVLEFYGNVFTSTGYIITQDMCISSELRCLDEMLVSCLKYWCSTSNYLQSVHTTLVWPLYFISGFPLRVIVRSFELRLFSNAYATISLLLISLEGGNITALSNEPDRHCCSSEVKESVVLNLPRNYSNYVLCDRLLLPLGNSGQQANASYYQFCFANRYTSCLPGNHITSGQLQVTASCSAMRLLLSAFSPSFCLMVMPELNFVRAGSQCVYLQKLQLDTSELEGATLNSIGINGNRCQLKWCEASLAYSAGMVMYCSSFSCTREVTSCESILAPAVFSFSWPNLICYPYSANLLLEKILEQAYEPSGTLLYISKWVEANLIGMFHEFENGWNYMENLQLLKLNWVSEQETLNSGFQFHWYMALYLVQGSFFLAAPAWILVLSLSNILADWHLHTQTYPAAVCITELEGNIGYMESMPFIEALHQVSFSLVVKALMHSMVACSQKLFVQWFASSEFKDVVATSAPEAYATVQLSVIEVCRHDLGLRVAYTQEFNTDTQDRVVLYMPEAPIISDPECQVVLLSFCEKTYQLEFLWQEGTRASQVICKLRLQNHQGTMQMKKVGLPRCHTFVWRLGEGYQDWQLAPLAIARVQPVLLHVLAYQLSVLTPTVFSFAGGNSDCNYLILKAQGICAELLNCRSSEASDYCSMADCGSLVNTLKKHSLPWDPGGKHMTSLDRHIVFRFPWDPGVAAAAWGQAAFQGGRGVRDPSYTSAWAWTGPALEHSSWAWALPSATTTGTTSTGRTTTREPSRRITTEPALSLSSVSLPLYPLLLPPAPSSLNLNSP